MEITPQLCETSDDPAYNCGRLLAVLDSLQYAAQGRVGAGIVSRYYGSASTIPANVFPYLIRHSKHHVQKLMRSESKSKKAAAIALQSRIDTILGRFRTAVPGGAPEFPGLLSLQQQGRFALGFHQQKGHDERAWRLAKESKERAEQLDQEAAEALAIAEAAASARSEAD